MPLDAGHWTLGRFEGGNVSILREETFGHPEGKPVTGDFNGDGVSDVGVFHDGHWYLDLNGNGVWDEGDLWAKLGTEGDLPVTGDWDGDGKTDIGIYGPAWARDPWAIQHEPGLPDADNYPTKPLAKTKNVPPTPDEATSGGRLLQADRAGQAAGRPDRPRVPLRRAGRRADRRRLERRRHPRDRRLPRRPVDARPRRRRPLHRDRRQRTRSARRATCR